MRRSRRLLFARCGELFKLMLSFLGWGILSTVLSLLVSGVCVGLGCGFFLTSGSLTALTASLWTGEVLSFLLPLPLTICSRGITPHPARYYCAVSAGEPRPPTSGRCPERAPGPF